MTCGILLAERLSLSVSLTSFLLAGVVAAGILLHLLSRSRHGMEAILTSVILCVLAVLGAWKFAVDERSVTGSRLAMYVDSAREVWLVGSVHDQPQKKSKSFQFVLRVSLIRLESRTEKIDGDILILVRKSPEADSLMMSLRVGDPVAVYGKLEHPKGPRNPGEFDFRRYLLLNDISAVVYLKSVNDLIKFEGSEQTLSPLQTIARLRARIASAIDETVGGVEGAFLKGIVIGDRSEIPTEVKTSFVNAGVLHVLAVSGLNVGMVALIFMSAFSLLRLGRSWTTLLTLGSIFIYMFLTGSTPSVVRATIMATVFLTARLIQRKSDLVNSLAFAAIAMYLVDAKQLFDPGFQLSFAAVGSILYFYPKIVSYSEYFPERLRRSRFLDSLWKLFAVTTAAQVGTIPFTVAYFGKVSIVSLVANLFVIPAVGVALALGFAISFASLFSNWLAAVYGEMGQLLLNVVLHLVDYSGSLPFAFLSVRNFDLLDVLIFYAVAVFLFNLKEKQLRKRLIFAVLILANIAVFLALFTEGPRLRVTILDVGQGDATLVEFPSGKTLLVDGGPKTFAYDAGERTVVPFLKRTVKKLDAVVVSHPHNDHLGGIEAVLRNAHMGTVYDAGHVAESQVYRKFLERIDSLKLPLLRVRSGERIDLTDEARIYVLHPTKNFIQRDSLHYLRDFNNSSVVLKIQYGKVSVLLPGDAEEPAEAQMLFLYDGFLRSDLLKVGHHGSITSSGEEFVKAIRPKFAAISVGANNKYGHPSPETVARFRSLGTDVHRTDLEGALIYESDGKNIRRVLWRSEHP